MLKNKMQFITLAVALIALIIAICAINRKPLERHVSDGNTTELEKTVKLSLAATAFNTLVLKAIVKNIIDKDTHGTRLKKLKQRLRGNDN
jgi:hypothetical protein